MKNLSVLENCNPFFKLLLFGITFFFSQTLLGQEQLIKQSQLSMSELNFSQSESLALIQSKGMYSSYNLIEFKSLAESQNNGRITIDIPGDNCGDLIYKAKAVNYINEQEYSWYGVLDTEAQDVDCSCRLGSITLISSVHGKIGHIMVDDNTFELLQLGEGKYVLGKLDETKFTASECGVNKETPIHNSGDIQPRNEGNCNVRCLILYTNNALISEGSLAGINNRANLAINQTNQALRNSDIYDCELKIDLAGVQPFNFVESGNMRFDITDFATMDAAQSIRDDFEADIVVLLTNGDYGDIRGIVDAIGPNDNTSYAIVQIGVATTGRFTFGHEVGHLFGGGHEFGDDTDNRPGIPHGHSFRTGNFLPCIFGKKRKTMMHTTESDDDFRIQHFSNPDVYYDGQKTGVAGEKDNARQLRNEACVVAQFRETIQPLGLTMGGDNYMCPCQAAHQQAIVFGGTAGVIYNFTWFTSIDGINWDILPYTGSNAVVNVPCTEGDVVFVRVDVVGSDGNMRSISRSVEASMEWPGQEAVCMRHTNTANASNSTNSLTLAPNPTDSSTDIILQLSKEATYSITVKDIKGRIISTVCNDKVLAKGTHRIPIDIKQVGLFFVHCMDNTGNQMVEKLIKM